MTLYFFFKLADGDPLESAYNAIHFCGKLTYGNDICITITNIFENMYTFHKYDKIW